MNRVIARTVESGIIGEKERYTGSCNSWSSVAGKVPGKDINARSKIHVPVPGDVDAIVGPRHRVAGVEILCCPDRWRRKIR